ncbi:MAG: FkbM family methyltransferase [Actinomycetota bacterium]
MSARIRATLLRHPRLLALVVTAVGLRHGVRVRWLADHCCFAVLKGDTDVLVARHHGAYLPDLVNNFVMMTERILPDVRDGRRVYDFTTPVPHRFVDGSSWSFPGLPEVDATSDHYIETLGVKPGDVVWDIGAYSGLSTKAFAQAVGTAGTVVAVEADPTCFGCVASNLPRDSFPTVHLVQAALWDDDGTVEFQAEANQGSTIATAGTRATNVIDVRALTPETLFKQVGTDRVDAVKLDIEGAEYRVVPAFAALFATVRPKFLIEVHKNGDEKVDAGALIQFFAQHDYEATAISQPEKSPFPLVFAHPRA